MSHEDAEDEEEAGVAEDDVFDEFFEQSVCLSCDVYAIEDKEADKDDCYEGVDVVVAEEAVDLLLILTAEQAKREELEVAAEVYYAKHLSPARVIVRSQPRHRQVAQNTKEEEPDAGIFKEF